MSDKRLIDVFHADMGAPYTTRVLRENWMRMALQFIRVIKPGNRFTSEDLSAFAVMSDLPQPKDSRWWGAVLQKAARQGLIRRYTVKGFEIRSTTRAKHRAPVWERI